MEVTLPERYELVEPALLGEGGMGRVVRARDTLTDVPVALKLVRPDLAADPRFKKLFDREVRISARFIHPHIVPLHDHGVLEDGTPWLGLALADAGSIKDLVKSGPDDWTQILRLMLQLLDALGHLHAYDVVHRDIKPENILLHKNDGDSLSVWLSDLGLANVGDDLARRKGKLEGTPGYMPPEQAMGLPREFSASTDLYAVGAVMWELVTGVLPFPENDTSATADLPTLEPRDGLLVPRGLSRVLTNLLDPEPLSRYDLAADLRTELLALGEANVGRGQFDGPDEGVGTVAPAANALLGASSVVLEAMKEGAHSQPGLDPYVPYWNRPLPPPLPEAVPELAPTPHRARGSIGLFALHEPPLVAREEGRQALWDVVRSVRETRTCQVVLVVGPAGCGKTRLVQSVVHDLQAGGWAQATTLQYQDPRGVEDGYFGAARAILRPWKESRASLQSRLRRRLSRERGSLDLQVKDEANLLTRWCGLADDSIEEDPVPQGLGLREVYRHLEARSWRGLSVMVLENVHHGLDEGDGLALVEARIGSADEALLMVATLRSEELESNADLRARVEALEEAGAHRVNVGPLTVEQTQEMMVRALSLEPDLAQLAAERCEGNPLFARQLLLEWSSREWLARSGVHYRLADGVDVSSVLPTDARALLESRLEGLAEASANPRRFKDTLHMAAMAGASVPLDLVEALAGEEIMERAVACDLWSEAQDRLIFTSALIHQAMRELAEARRDASYLHRRLGRALVRYGESSGHDVDLEVGRHSMEGRDYEVAMAALQRACIEGWRRRNPLDLGEAGQLAVEAARRSPAISHQLGWSLVWLGRGRQLRGDLGSAQSAFNEALTHAGSSLDVLGQAAARIGLAANDLQFGNLGKADEHLGVALELTQNVPETWPKVMAVETKGWVEQRKRNFEGAEILFTRAGNWARKDHDLRGMAECLLGQAYVSLCRGDFEEAAELYEEAATAFQDVDDLMGMARAWLGSARVRRQRSEFDEALELIATAEGVGEELGSTSLVMETRYRRAQVLRRRGSFDESAVLYNEHLAWATRHQNTEGAIFSHLGLALVALRRSDLHDLYDRTTAVSRLLEPMPGHWLWATYRLIVAAMLAHRGDRDGTFTWLWSSAELGISDTVDEDVAFLLTDITAIALRSDWRKVLRVAGREAIAQLQRLGDPDGAKFVKEQMDRVLLSR